MARIDVPMRVFIPDEAPGLLRAAQLATMEAKLCRMHLDRLPVWSLFRRARLWARFQEALLIAEDLNSLYARTMDP